MTPALHAELGRVFDAEARALDRVLHCAEAWGGARGFADQPWRWDDYEVPPALRSVPALRAEVTRLRREARRSLPAGP